ncbi:MAG: ribonuclease R [Bacteroidota bacterium]|nr:ribonuclease R [Bacteroidota bacterium]
MKTKHSKKDVTKKVLNLGKNPFMRTVFEVFAHSPYRGFNFKQVSSELGISDKPSRILVNNLLEELMMNEAIVEIKRGKYKLNPELITETAPAVEVVGTVDMKQTGKAYVMVPGADEDIYIAANNVYHALHGDKVKVNMFPKRKGKKPEGVIVGVLERFRKQYVGILKITPHIAWLHPDEPNILVDFIIPKDKLMDGKNGQKVVTNIIEWPDDSTNPIAEVIAVLGTPGNNDVEMQGILASYDFPIAFPRNVEREAETIPEEIPETEITRRRDFRKVWTCTIDPEDAKDFDDALSLKKLDNGNWQVGVHIADVSYYVRPGKSIDAEAYDRGTSIYLVDRTIPMLPEKLSNKVCSLRPNEEKLCYSVVWEMDGQANLLNEWIGKTVIKSDRRYAYEEVQAMIEGGDGDYKPELLTLHQLASCLRDERFKHGSIAFRSAEVKFKIDEQGHPIEAYVKEQKEANRLIEDFMLLANKRVAEHIGKVNGKETPKTFVYRVHDEPNPAKLATFIEFVGKLGYPVKSTSQKSLSSSLNKLFIQISGKAEENLIESIAVRTMAKAEYSTQNIGHYGLSFKYYTHFTSPIRRYPDLMVHRLLERYMDGGNSVPVHEYEEKCEHTSDMERRAAEAERASIKYKQAEYMLDKIGKEFQGVISGVSKWGIYVEIDAFKCEGMVALRTLMGDNYILEQENYRVIGQRRGKVYRLGDRVQIKVMRVDLSRKQMDFILVE